ncbi:MAG: PIN domain-containing protein [Chloroflexi bacterium]|nr:PIN domain-containing protein [Chloroflexota bacterium]
MPPVLIDTNLLVYLFDLHSPDKAGRARQVLERLEAARSGRLSVQNLAEFLHVVTRKLNPPLSWAQALAQAGLFTRMWPVFDLTPLIVLEAARGARDHGLAYYDALVWASARLNQVTTIFSEDFNAGEVLEGVRFVNPFAAEFRVDDWV